MRLAQKLHKGKKSGWDLGVEVGEVHIPRRVLASGFCLLLPHLGGPADWPSSGATSPKDEVSTEY